MTTYGQFCPVAKAMEVLDERWTLLVVRELLLGSTHFNELRRGVPKMSPALFSKRLRSLERAGIVHREVRGQRVTYGLTECGRELEPVVDALGMWGLRWIGDLGEEDLDPHLLLWDVRRTIPLERWPRARTVLHIQFDDVAAPAAQWWLVVANGEVDVCDYDPGHEVTASLETSLRTLTRLWRGEVDWTDAVRTGRVVIDGPTPVRRQVPEWIGSSSLAQEMAAQDAAAQPA